MNLYTFVLDYDGGTYVSQIEDKSAQDAMIKWIRNLDLKTIKAVNVIMADILKDIRDLDKVPLPLSDVKNVWCITFIVNNNLALVNIIKTDKR